MGLEGRLLGGEEVGGDFTTLKSAQSSSHHSFIPQTCSAHTHKVPESQRHKSDPAFQEFIQCLGGGGVGASSQVSRRVGKAA